MTTLLPQSKIAGKLLLLSLFFATNAFGITFNSNSFLKLPSDGKTSLKLTLNDDGQRTDTYPDTMGTFTGSATYCQNGSASSLSISWSNKICVNGNGSNTDIPITITWYKNTTNSNTGGTSVQTTNTTAATTSSTLTPPTDATGTLYYYVVVSWAAGGNCAPSGSITTSGTQAITVNQNTAGTASSTPTLCINTALTAITHTTIGSTGIGATTGLPAGVTASFSSNTITISGTPTAAGTFNYSIPLTGGCGTISATGTITVIPNQAAAAASSTPTLCINTTLTNITHATTGATGTGTATGLPNGVIATWASNTITISGTPTESGTFSYSIPLTGACGAAAVATGTIIVTPNNTVGAASDSPALCIDSLLTPITHTTTAGTGIGAGTGLPAGVTAVWASNTITISGTPTAAGTFNYTIPLTGCGNISATGTIRVDTNTAGAASSTPTLCINSALTDINHTTIGATGIGTATGLPSGVTAVWTSDIITISGTPTVSGTFNYSIPLVGGCGTVSATGTITVTPDQVVTAASSTPTLCINTALTNITHATTGATGIGTATGLPTGVTASWALNAITISGTPTVSGTFNYSVPLTAACGAAAFATGTITVTPNNTVTTASATPALCVSTVLTPVTHTSTGATGIGATSGLPAGITAAWASDTITISGTPTASGTFNYSIPLTGGCGTANATGTITVTPNQAVAVASSTPTLCINTALTNITHATTSATGIGSPTNLPAGVTATWASNVITISGTPSVSGTFNYNIPLTANCGVAVAATGTITVNPASSAGTVSADQTICNGSSPSSNITIGGATGIIQWKRANDAGFTSGVLNVGTNSTTLTTAEVGALTGTKYFRAVVTNGTCASATSATVTVTVNPTSAVGSASGNQTICTGSSPSANITVAGTIGTIQWQSADNSGFTVGLDNIGSNSSSLTAAQVGTLTATKYFRAVVTSGVCTAATSGTVTVTVSPTSSVGAVSANQTICNGSSPSSNITTASAMGTVQWQRANDAGFTSGLANIGSNSSTLTPVQVGPLSATRYFRAVVTSGACTSTTSGTVTVTVNPTSVVGAVSANQTICNGSSPSANITIASPIGTIQWQSADNSGFTIGLANLGTSSAILSPAQVGTLTATKYFRAVVKSGICPTVTSGTVTVTVNPTSAAGTVSANQTICTGSSPSSDISIASATGTIQWKSADDLGFTSGLANIGSNSSTLTIVQIGALTTTKYFRAVVTSGVCPSITSGTVTVTVNPAATANAGSNQAVCSNGNIVLAGTIGGSATSSTWSASSGSFSNASSLTSTYIPNIASGAVTLTLTTNDPAGICPAVTSTMTVTVNPVPETTGVAICQGESGFGSGSLTSTMVCPPVLGQTWGPNYAGAGANIPKAGSESSWSNSGSITTAGSPYASIILDGNDAFSDYLTGTNFGFTIPTNATISGITVLINRTGAANTYDNSIRLVKNGILTGSDRSTGTAWSNSFETISYGGVADLWGYGWTAADLNASDFGVAVSVKNGTGSSKYMEVDYIQIKVTYVDNGTIKWYTQSSGGTSVGSGSPFNPVGVAGSGLPDTSIPGTTTYYAECSTNLGCRTATTFTINPNLVANVSTAASPSGAICVGTSITFTATPTNGGTTPSYQWKLNGNNVGTNSPTYTSSSLANNDIISVVMTSNASPCLSGSPVTSNQLTIITTAPAMPLADSLTQPSCTINTGSVTLSNLPGGSWTINPGSIAGSGSTFTLTGLASGTYNYTVTDISGCTSPASSNVIINSAPTVPSAPTIGTITHPTLTVPTGSFIITNYNPGYTYTLNPSVEVTFAENTGTAPAGTYTITATLGNCTSASGEIIIIDNTKVWNGSTSSDWFIGSNWTPSGVPTADKDVIIPNNVPHSALVSGSSEIALANTLTVLSEGKLELSTGSTLNITDKVNVILGGTLNLQSGASLIQTNDTANEGIINVYKDSAKIILNDYTYWSAPTFGTQTLKEFSPNSNPKYFLTYNNKWIYVSATATKFSPGVGYAIIAPKGTSASVAASKSFQFIGTPNNGDVSVTAVKDNAINFSSKLIGNPYPSAMDANKFIDANIYDATTNPNGTISGTLYFWTHNNGLALGAYTSNDYATYNKSGGTTSSPPNVGHANTSVPTQFIASCQGFIVETVNSGEVVFTNAMRSNGTGTANGNFYKNANAPTSTKALEKNRIWLNFTNNGGANFNQILLGYIETATNHYDPGFDGAYNNSSKTGMYSLIGNKNYTIQAKALPFAQNDVVPLGFTTDITGNATISIDHVDGLFLNGQDIFIEDKLLNVVHNLTVSPYTFSTEAGTFNNRFVMRYTDNALGLNELEADSNYVLITSKDQEIKIKSTTEDIAKVFVYDMLGRTIYQTSKINAKKILISDLKTQQVLIVKIVLVSGQSLSKKVVY